MDTIVSLARLGQPGKANISILGQEDTSIWGKGGISIYEEGDNSMLEEEDISILEKKKKHIPINKWAEDDQPRKKLIANSPSCLSDAELLALLINTGYDKRSAVELAREVMNAASNNLQELGKMNINQLMKIEGIGEAKASIIVATMELSRRRQAGYMLPRMSIKNLHDAVLYFKPILADQPFESFYVLYLNRACLVLKCVRISTGSITGTLADIRLILREALELGATNLILCHNHPSRNLKPSEADLKFTFRIGEAAKLHDIHIIDHIIVSEAGYTAIIEEGYMERFRNFPPA